MDFDIKVFVRLKIPDVIAITAKNTLLRRMGYKDILFDLKREEYYQIKIEAKNEEEAKEKVKEIVEKSNLFYNPNKHLYKLEIGNVKEKKKENGFYNVRVLVSFLEDGTSIMYKNALNKRLGYREVKDIKRGILWRLKIKADSYKDAKKIAEEIAVTKTKEKGLLANLHFQDYKII
jgi:phosphoribosylformylglycinamidine (FGAM) synthase PurS component